MGKPKDLRLDVDFFGHPKTRRLALKAGRPAVLSLVQLWAWAARYRYKGSFAGMSNAEIADAAGWEGDPGIFIDAIVEVGYLDHDSKENHFSLHDWNDYQPWIYNFDKRSEAGKQAAHKKYEKQSKKQSHNAQGKRDASPAHSSASPPSPSLSPILKKKDLTGAASSAVEAADSAPLEPPPPIEIPEEIRRLNLSEFKSAIVKTFLDKHREKPMEDGKVVEHLRAAGLKHGEIVDAMALFFPEQVC